jgi:hypothetical protein
MSLERRFNLTELLNQFAEGDEDLIALDDVLEDVEESIGFDWYIPVICF